MKKVVKAIKNGDGVLIETKQTECLMRTRNWLTGSYSGYKFEAIVYDIRTERAIGNGRIIRLYIWKDEKIFGNLKDYAVATFNCGWKKKPKSDEDVKVYETIVFCLEELMVRQSI